MTLAPSIDRDSPRPYGPLYPFRSRFVTVGRGTATGGTQGHRMH